MRHVLVVDDDDGVRGIVAEMLSATCRVSAAESVAAARNIVESDPPELAVVDMVMPGVLGGVLADDLRRRGIPVVVMTGSYVESEIPLRSGLRFLAKPFRANDLLTACEAALGEVTGSSGHPFSTKLSSINKEL